MKSAPLTTTAHVWNPVTGEWQVQTVLFVMNHTLGIKAKIPKGTSIYDTKWNLLKVAGSTYTAKLRHFKPGIPDAAPAHVEWGENEMIARFSDVDIVEGRGFVARFISESPSRVVYDKKKELLK